MSNQKGDQPAISPVPGEPPGIDADFWLEWGELYLNGAVDRLDEAAKQIISITSILQGVYLAAISFSDLGAILAESNIQKLTLYMIIFLFITPVIIWLISLAFAVSVIVPYPDEMILKSPSKNRKTYENAVGHGSKQLKRAHRALIIGFLPLVINFVIYLFLTQIGI